MVVFDSIEALFYTLAVAIPGFFLDRWIGLGRSRSDDSASQAALRIVCLSIVCYVPWFWIVLLMLNGRASNMPSVWKAGWLWYGCWAWLLLLWPNGLGWTLATRVLPSEKWPKLLLWLGIRPEHLSGTAWEYIFTTYPVSPGEAVVVTLDDGTEIAGSWDPCDPPLKYPRSAASTDAKDHDLFLASTYVQKRDGSYVRPERPSSVWIAGSAIRKIEFWYNPPDGKD